MAISKIRDTFSTTLGLIKITPKKVNEIIDKVNTLETNTFTPSYKVYTALVMQSGTSAPVATVLENTLGGTVVWTRDSQGVYAATLAGAFTVGKTAPYMLNQWAGAGVGLLTGVPQSVFLAGGEDGNAVWVKTMNAAGNDVADDNLYGAIIEIRVYN